MLLYHFSLILTYRCGTGAYAAFNLKGVHGFEARKSPTLDGDNWYEKSPNFLYNPKDISAVAFMGSKVQVGATAYRKTNITCYLKPCKSFSDSRCFVSTVFTLNNLNSISKMGVHSDIFIYSQT